MPGTSKSLSRDKGVSCTCLSMFFTQPGRLQSHQNLHFLLCAEPQVWSEMRALGLSRSFLSLQNPRHVYSLRYAGGLLESQEQVSTFQSSLWIAHNTTFSFASTIICTSGSHDVQQLSLTDYLQQMSPGQRLGELQVKQNEDSLVSGVLPGPTR